MIWHLLTNELIMKQVCWKGAPRFLDFAASLIMHKKHILTLKLFGLLARAASLVYWKVWSEQKMKVDSLAACNVVVSERMALYRKLLWSLTYRIAEMNLNLLSWIYIYKFFYRSPWIPTSVSTILSFLTSSLQVSMTKHFPRQFSLSFYLSFIRWTLPRYITNVRFKNELLDNGAKSFLNQQPHSFFLFDWTFGEE